MKAAQTAPKRSGFATFPESPPVLIDRRSLLVGAGALTAASPLFAGAGMPLNAACPRSFLIASIYSGNFGPSSNRAIQSWIGASHCSSRRK